MKTKIILREAVREDCEIVLDLIRELAVFEKAENEVELTVNQLEEDAFGANPIVEIRVAEVDGEIVGASLIYEKYSTWKGRSVHLEDLIVRESHRGMGIGTLLFNQIVNLSKERGYGRMEWQVLDWNKPAITFYEKYNTTFLYDWLDCRLTSDDIKKL